MAQVSGQGTTWNLLNYWGKLFTADLVRFPFLSMIGGLSGGGETTPNFEFAVSSEYDFASAAQPAITETESLTAPTATEAVREQAKNVTQIFQQAVAISYVKSSNFGRLSGINTANKQSNVLDEVAFQINYNLQIIARNMEWTYLQGVYQIATSAAVANKTRGMLPVCDLSGGSAVAAAGATLSKALMDSLFSTMFGNGSEFITPVIWVNSFQKIKLSEIYGYAPADRTIGGVNIKQIETDFGTMGVADAHRFMPAAQLLLADMSVIKPVTQPVPVKGNMFYETLAKTGASENGQIFGQAGLDHGPAFAHGKITGLATS